MTAGFSIAMPSTAFLQQLDTWAGNPVEAFSEEIPPCDSLRIDAEDRTLASAFAVVASFPVCRSPVDQLEYLARVIETHTRHHRLAQQASPASTAQLAAYADMIGVLSSWCTALADRVMGDVA